MSSTDKGATEEGRRPTCVVTMTGVLYVHEGQRCLTRVEAWSSAVGGKDLDMWGVPI